MPSSRPCSRTCGTDPPIDGSGRDPRAVPRSTTGRPAAGRPRRLRACAGGTARQRPGVRRAVRRVPGRARDARRGRVDRRRPDASRHGWRERSGSSCRRSRTSSTRPSWPCRTGPRSRPSVGLVGLVWTVSQFYGTLDIAFARIFTDRPERDVFRRTARGLVSVAGLVGVIVALIVGGSLAAAAEAFLPNSSPALGRTGSRARFRAGGDRHRRGRDRHRLPDRAAPGSVMAARSGCRRSWPASGSWPSASCSCSWHHG